MGDDKRKDLSVEKRLKIGVVGCGYWGPNLVRNLMSLPDCEMSCICDVDEARLSHLKSLYPGVTACTSFERLLNEERLDAIMIATPVRLHHQLAKQSLLAGKHTLIEKPMASSSAECEELGEIARRNGLTLMVGHTFLYSPAVIRIREIITAGDIGVIRYISSRRLNLGLYQKDINVVWDLAPHDISIIQYLMGETPSAVNCQGKANITPGVEDVCNTTLLFANGGFATIHNSWLDPKKVREMTIVGTQRMIIYDDLEPAHKIRIHDQRVERPPHYDTFAEFHYSYHYGDIHVPYVKQEEPLRVECRHFLECIREGREPVTGAGQATDVVRILEAASESLRQDGGRVYLRASPRRP
jgi:predicted dehydrogenase